MKPDFAQRFISGFVVAGLGALAVLGVFIVYRLLQATGKAQVSDLLVGWLLASCGVALAGGVVSGVRLWVLWPLWRWWI